jgi:hypothetical protein
VPTVFKFGGLNILEISGILEELFEMGGACDMYGEGRGVCRVLVGET